MTALLGLSLGSKWSDEAIHEAVKLIKRNATITLQEIVDEFVGRGEELVSDSTLAEYLEGQLISYKQVTRQNQMRNDPVTIEGRYEYASTRRIR
jgi:nucleotide-binding universal stress UspA family protein